MRKAFDIIEEVFNQAIEIGNLVPFDTHSFVVFLLNNRLALLKASMLDNSPENIMQEYQEEQTLIGHATKLTKDFRPSSQNADI